MARIYKTVKPSAGDYTALETCLNAQEQDLTDAGGDYLDVEIDGDWSSADTTAVVIHNYTTNATSYINIYTTATARHAGVWSTTKYRVSVAGRCLYISDDFVRVTGLQLDGSTLSAGASIVQIDTLGAGADIRIGNCLVRASNNATYAEKGILLNDADGTLYVWNTIVYDISSNAGSVGIHIQNCTNAYLYGNTVISGTYGVLRSAGTVTAKNCYAAGSSGKAYSGVGASFVMTNCASSDTTAEDTSPQDSVPYDTTTFQSVTPGNANYLKPTNTGALYGAGTTLTDDPPGSTALGVDIAGTTRS